MQKTLWKQPEKKFAPRNKQAAMIVRPAKGFHCPPEEEKKPNIVGTSQQQLEARLKLESEQRRKRIAELEAEGLRRKAESEAKAVLRKEKDKKKRAKMIRKRVRNNHTLQKYLSKMQKLHGRSGWKAPQQDVKLLKP